MMSIRTTRRTLILTLVMLLSALGGCGGEHRQPTGTASAPIQARLAPVERIEVPLEVEVQGIVEAERTAVISARLLATVSAVHVRAGERVQRGQLLLEIDPQAADGQLAQAQGALEQARAALTLAERNFQRFTALEEAQAASALEVDMARMQYQQAKGAVGQAEGAVAAASSVASDTRVVAPFEGYVARKLVDVGDLAAPGRPLLSLESVAGRKLTISVPESLLLQAKLRVGDPLRVRIDSRTDLHELLGTIREMTPGADPTTHSFQVELDLPVAELATGTAGRAWIEAGSRTSVVVPATAVLRHGGITLVALRTAEGVVASRVVTVGRSLPANQVEILSGLSGDETVLLDLAAIPPPGATVEAAP